jgi:hypothetical protein
MPSKRGGRDAVSKRTRKQQFHKPGKAKRDRDLTGLKKIKRTAAKTATKDDDSALKAFFKDPEVRGDKSKAKSKSRVAESLRLGMTHSRTAATSARDREPLRVILVLVLVSTMLQGAGTALVLAMFTALGVIVSPLAKGRIALPRTL